MLDALVVLGWIQTSSLDSLRNVVLGLIGLEDARTRQLTRIESKVDAMIDSPYRSARDYLDSARRVGLDTDKGMAYLEDSVHDFRKAAANYSAVVPKWESWACLHLLLIYTALGDIPEAQEWGARGYEAAIRWVRMEISAFENHRELRRERWSLFGLANLVFLILAVLIAIKRGPISIGASKTVLITVSAGFIVLLNGLLTFGADHYRQFIAWRAKSQMKECDQFLNQMWNIWSSLSSNPAEVKFYKVCTLDDETTASGMYVKRYELRSVEPPGLPARPGLGPTPGADQEAEIELTVEEAES